MMRFSSNITSDPASSKIVDQVILLTQDYLTDFALNENFSKQVELAFGDRFDPTKLEELRQQWVSGQFEVWPKIETRPAAEINGAIGAFSADTNTVTLSQEYIAQNLLNLQEINTTVLEEIGHFVDSRINTLDVSGDEGEFFSALVRGVEFNEGEIYRLKSEDDRASITLNGQVFQVEQAAADIKRPILIIPGIGGTFGKDFNTRWYFNRGVKPEELEVDPIGGVYYDLIKTLKNVGYIEGENLFIANYDWRLPTGPLDSQIDGNIDGLSIASITDNIYEYGVDYLGYWLNQAKAKGASEVDIIAHSTGGLITRTYIQSDAYKLAGEQAGLPKINNFFMIGVPNRGASQAWNPLRDNWIRKADSKSGFLGIGETGPDRLVLSKIIKKAYQHVLEGGIITGLPSSISLETIKDSVTNKPDPVKFVNQYVPTLRNLLATYKFLEIVDEFPLGVFDVNNNPNERNSLLLDLNDGFDLSSISKPNSFADKSHPIAIYGTSELTETTVTKITGNRFGGNEFSDVILPFTDFLARDPEPKEVWYRSNAFERNGDGTVPLESSIGLFTNDSRIERKRFTKGDNTKEDVTHLGLMYNTDVQKLILDTLQISFEESNISKGSNFSTFDSLLVALFDINILGIGPFVPLNIHDSINSLENTSFDLSTKSLNFANFQNSANVLAADNLANFLSQLPDLLNEKLSTINLPLLGDSLKSLNFIDQLGLQDIADIKIDDKSNPDEVKVTLKLYKDISQFSLPIATDFGLPSLGLEVDGNTQLDVGLNFTLSFGVNKNTGFSIDTSSPNEFSIDLKASIPDLTAIGKMGFLQLKVSDEDADDIAGNGDKDVDGDGVKATNLVASLAVDILGDLNSGFSINKPELKGSANINLRLESSFDGSAKLPKIDTDLALNWDDLSKATPDEFKFNNITLNTGSFFTGFASPILDKIQTVTEPVQPIIKVLTTPIDLKVAKADLLDVGRKLGQIDESDENSIRSLQQLNSLADSIKNGGNVSLKLGSVDLTDKGDITQPDFSSKLTLDEQPVDVVAELEKVKAAAKTELEKAEADKAKTLVSSFKSVPGAGLEFPILTDPTTVVNLLLGKDVNLFAYDLPQLGFDFNYEQFFPVIGPLGVRLAGNVGANVDLNFGYDTVGLKQFIQSQDVDDIFNGFFVSDRKPPTGSGEDLKEATLNAGIKASASVEGGIVRGDAGGKIDGLLGLDLNDPSHPDDGKVRVNEINELLGCPFDVSGKLSAGLFARLQVGFGPFKYTKHFNFVNKTLLSFEAGCDAAVSHKPNKDNFGLAEDLGSGILHLNMGPRASKRRTSGQSGKDEDEVFAIQTGANTAAINVSAFSITEPYQGVVQIVADGGQEDDTIQIGEGVAIATSSKGGSGNDQLYGGSGNDTLNGEAGDDALFGGKGDDDLLGGDGDDYLEGGAGADTLDGGSNSDNTKGGGDTVSYKDSPVEVRFNVDPSDSSFFIGSGGDAQGDKLRNIEHIEGSNFDDRLLGDKSSNTLEGLRGNDTLEGGGGDDILLGGIGADRLDGGSGRDWTGYVASSAEVKINLETGKASSGDAEGDTLISIEDIKGSIHNDVLIGSRFNNYLDGFLGDDRIIGSSGADTLDGGEGRDWVSYETSANGVNVSLRTGQGQDGDAQGDELVKVKDDKGNNIAFNSFENLEGSLRHDTLEGDIGNNIIKGLSGNDTLKGDGGDDTLIGGSGEDRLDGGDGIDWADYSESSAAVTVNLQFGSGSGADAQGDTFVRINNRSTVENLLGSNFADALFSDDGDNEINPGLSNSQNNEFDVVDGGGGNDLLTLDYSFNDFGTGLFGGFTGSYIGFGPGLGFFRKTSDGNRFQDAVAFSNIEHLKIIGTIQDDEIYGGAGDDILLPGAGDDVIYGGDGNNTIYGDDDDDYLVAGSGNDTLTGGVGNDTIYGGLGSNTINADDGNDVVIDQDVNGKFIDGIPISSSKTYLDGGRGIDTLSIDLSARDADNAYPYGDVTLVNLDPSKESSTEIELLNGSVIKNFEIFKDIRTGISADKIVQLGRVNNVIETGSGSDIVNPGLGFDEVNGGYFDSDQVGGSDTLILDYSVEDTGTGIFADIPSNTPFFGGSYYRYKDEQKLELLDRVEFRYFTRYEITGTSKNDEIYGGAGDDILLLGAGNDTIYGGLGSNIINADDGNDVVIDQDVAGKLVGSLNSSKIYLDGGRGIDTLSIDLSARDGNNLYPYGDITLISLDPSQENTGRIELLNGSVIANFEIFQNIRTGISADQIIQLGRVDNVIQTGSGSDIVNPGLGFDFVDGGYFDLDQGPGSDTLILDYSVEDTGTGIFADIPSNTPFFGGSYYRYKDEQKLELLDRVEFRYFTRYEITGTSKNDRLIGGNGADILRGQSSKDTLYGGLGDDSLFGGDGDDLLLDGDDFPNRDDATSVQVRSGGNDIFRGGNGNDILVGLASNDRLFGEADNDSLFGGEGSDILDGGEGNDILNGFSLFSSQESKDILIGGLGADEFQLGDENHIYYVDNNIGSLDNENFVRITDFNPIEGDILQLHGSPENYSLFVTPESTAIFKGRFGIEGLPADLIAIFEGANIDLKASHVRFVNSATRSSSSFSDSEYSFLALDQAEIIPLENTLVQSNIAESTVQTSNQVEEISTVTLFQAQDSLVSIPIQAQAPELVSSVATLSQVETTDSLFRVTPNNNKGQLLEDLLGDTAGLSKITVELVELIGDGRAFGTFKNDPFELGLGVVISTGRVEDLKGSNSEDGGFTQSGNQDLSRDFAEAGVAGDSISLKIEFDADATKEFLFFQYAFGSEEFAEFGGSPFNDNFSLTLNGFNYARLTDGSTVSINNLVPSPFGPYHPDFIYNPAQTGPVSGETKLDGYTKPLLFQAPLIQNGRNTLVINVQDVNDGIFDSAVFIKGGTVGTKLPTTKTLDGKGGQKSISVNANDGAIEINDFGGVGRGINPSPATIAEADTLKFTDARLTARNMLLTQNGSNLEITFEGITDTKVVLTNLALENLDNLRKETGASVNLGNILFSGQTEFQDSYDVLNAESQLSQIPNHNTVTFLNDLNNTIKGFSKSDDVINGQGGNDQIDGLSGDDLLRGGTGNDSLLGNNGDDILVGGVGSDSVTGGEGRDRFILEPNTGVDTITDFQDKHDQIDLSGIALTQLLINQGTGTNRNDALISFNNGGATELLAIVTGVKSNLITSDDFVAV